MQRRIRVLVADDNADLRHMLRVLLDLQGVEVVGESDDGVSAIELARDLKPDVVLVDFHMPGMNGVEVTAELRTLDEDMRIIMFTGTDEGGEQAHAALEAGASSVIAKDVNELVEAIKAGPARPRPV